jgi:hypothetical protein
VKLIQKSVITYLSDVQQKTLPADDEAVINLKAIAEQGSREDAVKASEQKAHEYSITKF